MNRRQALSLLAVLPFATRVGAQTRASAKHRVILGAGHGLLLEPDGTLQSWSSERGAGEQHAAENCLGLGHNRPVALYTLYPVTGLNSVVAAAAASGTSYAVLADGRLLAWGVNGSGQLGITPLSEFETRAQPRASTNTPTPVAVRFEAVDVSSKGDHVMALARDGSVYTWGHGASGQLGIGPPPVVNFRTRTPSAMPYVPLPIRVPDLTGVVAISAGGSHSLALLQDGTIRAWGANKSGQVGDGTRTDHDKPVAVPGVRNAVAIAAGFDFSVAVLADGTAVEWGAGYTSNDAPRPVPAAVAGTRGLRSVVAGNSFVVAATQAGAVMTWGQNTGYEAGRGRNATSAPALVNGVTAVQSVAANTLSTGIAVLASGRILTWGQVREWTRPDGGGAGLSPFPILLWLDGLDQP
jgi:alpha-tubulin suppressor-like RCC1 family protein